MSALLICKYCESEYEELEFDLDNWCCDGMRANLLEAELARLQKAVEEAERIFTTRFHMAFGMYSISTKDIETWLKEYGKG